MRKEIVIDEVEFIPLTKKGGNLRDGFIIAWSGNRGFGEYRVYKEDGKWVADSEYMDWNEDKSFIMKLMEKFIEGIDVQW